MTTQTLPQAPSSVLTGTLLVSGTCIGGGMLVLPVQTAFAGFWLSSLALLICWAFMTYTGLLLAEATLWVKNETHFASLSRILIGKSARILSLLLYLFMNYASLVAYTSGGADLFPHLFGYPTNCVLFTLLFGSAVYFGAKLIGRLNLVFFALLAFIYLALLTFASPQINLSNLAYRPAWAASTHILSIILATFSYQMIVPSLCHQMHYQPQQIRRAILWGTAIPCLVYLLWIAVIHGAIPLEGPQGLRAAWESGSSATKQLQATTPLLSILAASFGFVAIVTSYFGLSLALFYFLKDCLNELNLRLNRFSIVLWTLIPTLLLALFFPRALLQFLDISGGLGDTLLSGLIPIAMVWIGRYNRHLPSSYRVPGGKPALVLSAAFYLLIFSHQLTSLL